MRATRCGRPPGSPASKVGRRPPLQVIGRVIGQIDAVLAVGRAVRDGRLVSPRACRCDDCARPASEYDHRDYNAPLVVAPVCHGCNVRRGPAIPREGAIDSMLARGAVPYMRRTDAEKLLRAMGRPTTALDAMPKRLTVEHWRQFWPAPAVPEPAAQEA